MLPAPVLNLGLGMNWYNTQNFLALMEVTVHCEATLGPP